MVEVEEMNEKVDGEGVRFFELEIANSGDSLKKTVSGREE